MIWSGNEIHKYIYETPNKEFVLISETTLRKDTLYSLNLTKIDSNGNIIWNRTFIDKFPSKYPTFFYIYLIACTQQHRAYLSQAKTESE